MKTWDLIHGECVTVMQEMDEASVDMVVTSPPYDKIRDYDGFSLSLPDLGDQLHRVLSDGGLAAVVIQDQTKSFAKSLTSFRLAVDWCDRVGFRLFECVIFERPGKPGGWWNSRFRVDHEYVLLFLKGRRPAYFNKEHLKVPAIWAGTHMSGTDRKTDGSLKPRVKKTISELKCRGTVWKHASAAQEKPRCTPVGELKLEHPATFPDALAEDLILCFCSPGGTVLDPMCGSGTTVRAAVNLGYRGVGIDMSEKYLSVAQTLLEKGL